MCKPIVINNKVKQMFILLYQGFKTKVCENTNINGKCGITFLKNFLRKEKAQIVGANIFLTQNIDLVNPQLGDKSCGRDVNLRIK